MGSDPGGGHDEGRCRRASRDMIKTKISLAQIGAEVRQNNNTKVLIFIYTLRGPIHITVLIHLRQV